MTLIETVRKDAKSARWAGVLILLAGIVALGSPLAAGLSITIVVGLMLLVGGASQLLVVWRAGSFRAGLMLALLAVLTLIAGVYMVSQPLTALATLTLFLAGYFIALGIVETVAALAAKPSAGWGWLLLNGIISFVLGVLVWRQFPVSGVWAVGALVGIRLIFSGWTLIMIGGIATRAVTTGQSSDT